MLIIECLVGIKQFVINELLTCINLFKLLPHYEIGNLIFPIIQIHILPKS